MKKAFILLQLLICFVAKVDSKSIYKDDVITIYLPNGSVIIQNMNYFKLGDFEASNNINNELHLLDSCFLHLGITEAFMATPRLITCSKTQNKYTGNIIRDFSIVNYTPKINYSIENKTNNQTLTQCKHKVTFSNEREVCFPNNPMKSYVRESQLHILFDSISQIEELTTYNWDEIYNEADSTISAYFLGEKTRETFSTTLSLGDNDSLQVFSLKKTNPSKYLFISPGFGVEFLKGDISSSFIAVFGLKTPRKRSYAHRIGVLLEAKCSFDESGSLRQNSFVGASYGANHSNRKGHDNWTIMEAGILVNSMGDEIFGKNTWFISFTQECTSYLSIYARIYTEPKKEIQYPSLGVIFNL